MRMDIVESDLKQLFMWIKNLDERVSSLDATVQKHQDIIPSLEEIYLKQSEERFAEIEHDLALVLSVIKDRKNST
tara:strand:- start:231 stop:455 length:225 start_codon:yes stop_codon:yes gene_type:complete